MSHIPTHRGKKMSSMEHSMMAGEKYDMKKAFNTMHGWRGDKRFKDEHSKMQELHDVVTNRPSAHGKGKYFAYLGHMRHPAVINAGHNNRELHDRSMPKGHPEFKHASRKVPHSRRGSY